MGQKLKRFGLRLIRQKFLWTIVAFIVIVGFLDTNSIIRRYELHTHNEELRQEIRKYEEQYHHDTQQLYELDNNPEEVIRVARVNLYMKTADEDVYVIEN